MAAEVEPTDQGQGYYYDSESLHVAFEFDDASTSDSDGTETTDYESSETSEDRAFVVSDTEDLSYTSSNSSEASSSSHHLHDRIGQNNVNEVQ